jgi:hypothetical protein
LVKIHINKNTKNLFIYIIKYVLKIPFSFKSYKNIRVEINNYKILKSFIFFKNFISIYNHAIFIIITKKGLKIERKDEKLFFNKYLEYCHENFILKEKNINNLISFLKIKGFLKNFLPHLLYKFNDLLDKTNLIISPCHGDLHKENVIKIKESFYIIDWLTFRITGSFLFDLINFKIISSKYYKNNWYYLLSRHQKKFHKFIDKKYFLIYIFWKIENEMTFMCLDNYKNNKYKKILENTLSDKTL